jgi:hypothetical protein
MGHIKSVGVFSGAQEDISQIYKDEARKLGKGIGKRKLGYLYGGGTRGLMGLIVREAFANGSIVTGVFPPCFAESEQERNKRLIAARFNEVAAQDMDEVIVEDLHERKKKFLEADAFFCFPGGIGTLDEIMEVMAANDIARHIDKDAVLREVILVNVNGYFDNFMKQLHKGVEEGFISVRTLNMLHVTNSADDALDLLDRLNKLGPRKVREIGIMRPEYRGQIPVSERYFASKIEL